MQLRINTNGDSELLTQKRLNLINQAIFSSTHFYFITHGFSGPLWVLSPASMPTLTACACVATSTCMERMRQTYAVRMRQRWYESLSEHSIAIQLNVIEYKVIAPKPLAQNHCWTIASTHACQTIESQHFPWVEVSVGGRARHARTFQRRRVPR